MSIARENDVRNPGAGRQGFRLKSQSKEDEGLITNKHLRLDKESSPTARKKETAHSQLKIYKEFGDERGEKIGVTHLANPESRRGGKHRAPRRKVEGITGGRKRRVAGGALARGTEVRKATTGPTMRRRRAVKERRVVAGHALRRTTDGIERGHGKERPCLGRKRGERGR